MSSVEACLDAFGPWKTDSKRHELPRIRSKDFRRRCDGKAGQIVAQGKPIAAKDEKAKAAILLADGGSPVPETESETTEDVRWLRQQQRKEIDYGSHGR